MHNEAIAKKLKDMRALLQGRVDTYRHYSGDQSEYSQGWLNGMEQTAIPLVNEVVDEILAQISNSNEQEQGQ